MSKHKKIEYHVPATETANISSDQTAVEELNSYNEADSTMFSLNDVKSHFSELKSTLPHSVKSRSRQLNLDFDQWMLHLKTVGQFRYSRTELLNILGTFLDSAAEDCSLLANKSGKVLHLIKDELEERSALLEQAYLALCNLPCPLSHMNEHRRMKLLEHVVVEEDLVAKKIDKLKEHCENTILSEAVERYQQDCCNYFNQVRELINKNYSIDQVI
ncbi:hypothetical protein GJ496_000288 [Pomphorhynchus laevis]|nr:hypothetical protein GJ496_000288 [Pomphorhynchus laevis]